MVKDIELFKFEENEVRTLVKDNEIWFVVKDICDVLEIANVSQAAGRLDDDEKGIYKIDTLGGKQDTLCVSESGLYSLTLTSNKPQAKTFKRWITHEVIPAIRKTGKYEVKTPLKESDKEKRLNLREERLSRKTMIDEAKFYRELAENPYLSEESKIVLLAKSTEILNGTSLIELPKIKGNQKLYTATEIAAIASEMFGVNISSQKIGRISESNNLKTDEYGLWILGDKQHTKGQIEQFKYYDSGKNKVLELLGIELKKEVSLFRG